MTRTLFKMAAGLAFAGLLAGASPAAAQTESFAKTGAYIGFSATPGASFEGGDFDGLHYLYDSDQIVLIPRLNSADAIGLTVGSRFDGGAIELSYAQAEHGATFAGARGVARSRVVSVDGKRFFLTRTRVQPYLAGGFAIPWLTVEKGAASETAETNATFVGVGFNAGGGVAAYLHRRVALSIGYAYRLAIFPRVKGTTGSFVDINAKDQPVSWHGSANASVSFTF